MQCVVSRKHVADRQLSKPVQKEQSTGFHLVRVAPSKIPSRGHSMGIQAGNFRGCKFLLFRLNINFVGSNKCRKTTACGSLSQF